MTNDKGSSIMTATHNVPTFNLEVSDTCPDVDQDQEQEGQEYSPTTIKTSPHQQRKGKILRRGKTKSLSNVKSSSNNSKAKTEWQTTTPPRPPNAWILYRSIKLKEMKSQPDFPPKVQKVKLGGNDESDSFLEVTTTAIKGKSACLQAEVSRIISTMWKNEDATIKAKYVKMAEDRKRLHIDMFPDYKYKPKRQKSSSSSMTKSLSMNHYSIPGGEKGNHKKMKKLSKAKSMLTVDAERAEYVARLHPRQQVASSDYGTTTSDYSPYSIASITLPSSYQHIYHSHHHHPNTVKQDQLEWDQSDDISDSNSMHHHAHHHHHHHQHGLNDWSVALAATMSKADYDQQIKKERMDEMEMHSSDLDGSTPSTADSLKIESSFSSNGGTIASDFGHHGHHHQNHQHQQQQPNYFGSFNGPDHIHHTSPSEIKFTSQLPQSKSNLAFTPVMLSSNSQDGTQHQSTHDQQMIANNAFPNSWQAVTNADFLPYLAPSGNNAPCSSSLGSQSIPYSPGYNENDLVSPTSSAFQQQSTIGDATIFLSQLNVGPTYGGARNTTGISAEDLAILNNINPSSSNHGNALHLHSSAGLSPHQIRQQQYQQWANNNLQQHSFTTPDSLSQQYVDGIIDTPLSSNQLLRPTLYRNAHSESGHDRASITTNSALSSPAISPTNPNRQDVFNGASHHHQNLYPSNSFSNANDQQNKQQYSIPSQW